MPIEYNMIQTRNKLRPNIGAIRARSELCASLQKVLYENSYLAVPTPIICTDLSDTSEAFVVCRDGRRIGYLATSPQSFKLELVSSGIERYFQIAPCFRAEQAHSRKLDGMHYQLDIETRNFTPESFRKHISQLLSAALFSLHPSLAEAFTNVPQLTYEEALTYYGTDKPDLRNQVRFVDPKRCIGPEKTGNCLAAIPVTALRDGVITDLTSHIFRIEQADLQFLKHTYVFNEKREVVVSTYEQCTNQQFRLASFRKQKDHEFAASHVVAAIGAYLNLIDDRSVRPVWITEFPMFEIREKGLQPFHDVFTAPLCGDDHIDKETLAQQFDLVCNGLEIASCAERVSSQDVLNKILEICEIDKGRLIRGHPNLFKALQSSAPSSIGCGIGIERLQMVIQQTGNIQDVLLFS